MTCSSRGVRSVANDLVIVEGRLFGNIFLPENVLFEEVGNLSDLIRSMLMSWHTEDCIGSRVNQLCGLFCLM